MLFSDAEPISSMYQTATSPTPSSDAGYRSGEDATLTAQAQRHNYQGRALPLS